MSTLSQINELLRKSSLLNEKEILVYEAYIGQKFLSPTQISRITGIKRTTVYLVLEELKQKGLLIEKIKGKRKVAGLAPAQTLRHLVNHEEEKVKEKSNMVRNIILLLENLQKNANEETEIEILEGKNGAIVLLEKILEQKENIYWLGSLDTILQIFEEEKLYKLFTWKRMDTKTVSYAITDRKILNNKKFGEKIEGFRQFRFLPENFDIPALIILFGNSVGLIRIHKKDLKIVFVRDKNISGIVKFMLDILWKSLPEH